MENSSIKGIVADFKNLIDRVSGQCNDEVTDKLFVASQIMLKDLLPYKYFILREGSWENDILVFDSKDARDEWLSKKCSLSVSPIKFSQTDELSGGEWDNLNNYKITPNGELILTL